MLKAAINQHLDLLKSNYLSHVSPRETAPEVALEPLEKAGIPLKRPAHVQHADEDERRSLLSALLETDGWSWEDVYGADQRSGAVS